MRLYSDKRQHKLLHFYYSYIYFKMHRSAAEGFNA